MKRRPATLKRDHAELLAEAAARISVGEFLVARETALIHQAAAIRGRIRDCEHELAELERRKPIATST